MIEKDPGAFDDVSEVLRSLRGAAPSREAERRIVAASLARIEKQQRPPFWRVAPLSLAGASAAVALGIGLHLLSPATQRPLPDQFAKASAGEAGTLHRAGEGPVSFAIGPHRIHLAEGASLRVEGADGLLTELRLLSGEATFDVEPLGPGEGFRVRTEEVLVEVVGTHFTVRAQERCSEVLVAEGRVRVSTVQGGTHLLGAGDEERYCPQAATDSLLREALLLASSGKELERAATLLARYRSENPRSALDEEALFHLCLVKARLGKASEARALAREFNERFPGSERNRRLTQWLEAQQGG